MFLTSINWWQGYVNNPVFTVQKNQPNLEATQLKPSDIKRLNVCVPHLVTLCRRKMVLLLSMVTSRLILTSLSYLSCLASSSSWKTSNDREAGFTFFANKNNNPIGEQWDGVTSESSDDRWGGVGNHVALLCNVKIFLCVSFTWKVGQHWNSFDF